jgi:diguanylate cyclase (GGDEF)-like protein
MAGGYKITRAALVLAAIWLIGLSAVVAVISLQHRVDSRRQAQFVVAGLSAQINQLIPMAFNARTAQGVTIKQTLAQLHENEARFNHSAALLNQLGGTGDGTKILALAHPFFATLDRVVPFGARNQILQGGALISVAEKPGGSHFLLVHALDGVGRTYAKDASAARTLSRVGSIFAILCLLAAFSFVFVRTTRLAADKQALLRKSRREALTDALTGLPNRRRLFADMASLLDERAEGETVALGMFDLDGFKGYNDTFGHPAGDELLRRLGQRVAAAVDGRGSAYRMGGDEFCVVARGADAEQTLADAQVALSEHSDGIDVRCSQGTIAIAPHDMTLEQALRLADQRLYADKRSARTSDGEQARDLLIGVLAEHSQSATAHMSSVGKLAMAVAQRLGLSEDDVTRTRLTAELHDIGKTAIPNTILNKPGPLDDQEWEYIRRHTIIGERILAAAPVLASIAPLVRASHERPDGTGYPDGLTSEEIPISSRIVAVVDAYDAMLSDRPYSPGMSPTDAIEELRAHSGTQFDAAAAQALIDICEGIRSARQAA